MKGIKQSMVEFTGIEPRFQQNWPLPRAAKFPTNAGSTDFDFFTCLFSLSLFSFCLVIGTALTSRDPSTALVPRGLFALRLGAVFSSPINFSPDRRFGSLNRKSSSFSNPQLRPPVP